jgi:hypothetical protein
MKSAAKSYYARDFRVYEIGLDMDGNYDSKPVEIANFAQLSPAIADESIRRPLIEQLAERFAEKLNIAYASGWSDAAATYQEWAL